MQRKLTLDGVIHWLKCRLIPKYREERIQVTQALIKDMEISKIFIQAKKDILIRRRGESIRRLEDTYRQMCVIDHRHPKVREIEKILLYQQEVQRSLIRGGSRGDIDVASLLNNIFATSDSLEIKNHGIQSR